MNQKDEQAQGSALSEPVGRETKTQKEKSMEFPATQFVETVQGNEPCCDNHARQLAGLMRFMGSVACSHPIPDGEEHECNNCRNEAKK